MTEYHILGIVVGVWLTLLYLNRCRHAWTLLTDKDFPTLLDEMKKYGFDADSLPPWHVTRWASRKYAAIVKCDKCGGIKKFEIRS